MRKIVSFLLLLLLSASVVMAQSRNITGKVVDENGNPVPFATIKVKDGKAGVSADANGVFVIKTSFGTTLTISSVGYANKEITVNDENVTISLVRTQETISEVVVTTAFNIKKDQRTTPFSAQVVKSDALNIIPQSNINDALAGKVAGVQFRSQSGAKLNSQTFARIRGGLALSGDVGPIFVVDGTIVGSDGYDIDPNVVDNVTVLKGANATALFGSRAINGAIVINTKRPAAGKTSIDVSQGVTFDNVARLPQLQNVYAGGGVDHLTTFHFVDGMPEEWRALDGKGFPDFTDDASWGPKMEGQEYIPWYALVPSSDGNVNPYSGKTAKLVPQPNNIKDYWQNGVNSNTNINFSKAGQGYYTRLSYSKQNIKGVLPSSQSDRNVVQGLVNVDLNKFISAGVDFTYNTQKIYGEYDDGYANQSSGNFGQWNHRDLDMGIMKELRGLRTPIGTLASWNWSSNPDGYDPGNPSGFYTGNYWYNFYSYFDNLSQQQRRDRLYGNIFMNVKVNNSLNIKATVRRDQYTFYYENIARSILEESGSQTGLKAGYSTGNFNGAEMNYELIANYNKTFFKDLGVNVLVGGNILTYIQRRIDANTVNGLNIRDLYALSNSKSPIGYSNTRIENRTNSWFASGDFEYKKFVSATWALRQDYNSTTPVAVNGSDTSKRKNYLFYPSAGVAFVASEFTKDALPWLSFAKVYASWGKKPLALDPYALNYLYGLNTNQWNGNFLMTAPNSVPDSRLSGALITSYEVGIEMKFAKNRYGLNVNYYNETSENQPVSVQVSGISGVTSKIVNAATVKRQGFEFTANAAIMARKDFSWNVTATLGYLTKNPITHIYGDQESILLTGGAFGSRYARVFQNLNQDWGQLQGGGMVKNSEGKPVIDATTGLFVNGDPTKQWGSIVPKVTGGFQNLFQYKNFLLNLSLDYQFGGEFFSLTESWGAYSGLLDYTAQMNDRGKNVRDPLSEGGGVHVTGVSSADNKTPVDMYVDAQTYFHQFYGAGIADPFVHKLSYVKVREISLGYAVPVSKISWLNNISKGITVSLIARNPWIIYSDTKNFDPAEISGVQGEDGQLPSVRSIGFNVKFQF